MSNNVAIDVSACGYNLSDAAVNIAQQIAAKVPTTECHRPSPDQGHDE